MTVEELCRELNLEAIAGHKGLKKEIQGCYTCDLLSWVISHSQKNNLWVTIHTHVNIIAVAVLAEIACIIITENQRPDVETINKADQENIPILISSQNAYGICKDIGRLGI